MTSSKQFQPLTPALILRRGVAFLLLLFISYGATAGAAHRHGNLPAPSGASEAATFKDSGDSGSTTRDAGTSGECLMCRMHQHLFAGLLHLVPSFVPPSVQLFNSTVRPLSYLSQTDAPRRGRAPPTGRTL